VTPDKRAGSAVKDAFEGSTALVWHPLFKTPDHLTLPATFPTLGEQRCARAPAAGLALALTFPLQPEFPRDITQKRSRDGRKSFQLPTAAAVNPPLDLRRLSRIRL